MNIRQMFLLLNPQKSPLAICPYLKYACRILILIQKKILKKKKFFRKKKLFWKSSEKQDVKLGEKSLIKKKITKDLIKKQIEKKIGLLDFDFLVGEILNKVINKNNPKSVSSGKKKIKVGLKQKKIKKNNEFRIPNFLEGQKSKFYILFIFLFCFQMK